MSSRLDRLAHRRAQRASRSSDVAFYLSCMSSALELSASPAEGLTLGELRDVARFVAGELGKLAAQIVTRKG